MEKERNELFDIARGFGILLIFWAHCGIWGPLGIFLPFIIVFHVPLFFFISGYFQKDNISWSKYLTGRAKRLLKPYYIWGALAMGVYLLVTPSGDSSSISIDKQIIYYIFGTRCTPYIFTGALWFLTALFSTSVMGYFAAKQSIKVQIVLSVICIFSCTLIGLYSILCGGTLRLPMNLDVAVFMLPIYLLGKNFNMINQYLSYSRRRFVISLLILIGVVIITYMFTPGKTISYHKGQYGFAPLSMLATLSGIYIVWTIVTYINNKTSNGFKSKLSWIGMNSMTFYIIHQQFVLHPLNSLHLLVSIPIFHGAVRFTICVVVSYFFTLLANKYLKWSFK